MIFETHKPTGLLRNHVENYLVVKTEQAMKPTGIVREFESSHPDGKKSKCLKPKVLRLFFEIASRFLKWAK
jgi:hypothetical protein